MAEDGTKSELIKAWKSILTKVNFALSEECDEALKKRNLLEFRRKKLQLAFTSMEDAVKEYIFIDEKAVDQPADSNAVECGPDFFDAANLPQIKPKKDRESKKKHHKQKDKESTTQEASGSAKVSQNLTKPVEGVEAMHTNENKEKSDSAATTLGNPSLPKKPIEVSDKGGEAINPKLNLHTGTKDSAQQQDVVEHHSAKCGTLHQGKNAMSDSAGDSPPLEKFCSSNVTNKSEVVRPVPYLANLQRDGVSGFNQIKQGKGPALPNMEASNHESGDYNEQMNVRYPDYFPRLSNDFRINQCRFDRYGNDSASVRTGYKKGANDYADRNNMGNRVQNRAGNDGDSRPYYKMKHDRTEMNAPTDGFYRRNPMYSNTNRGATDQRHYYYQPSAENDLSARRSSQSIRSERGMPNKSNVNRPFSVNPYGVNESMQSREDQNSNWRDRNNRSGPYYTDRQSKAIEEQKGNREGQNVKSQALSCPNIPSQQNSTVRSSSKGLDEKSGLLYDRKNVVPEPDMDFDDYDSSDEDDEEPEEVKRGAKKNGFAGNVKSVKTRVHPEAAKFLYATAKDLKIHECPPPKSVFPVKILSMSSQSDFYVIMTEDEPYLEVLLSDINDSKEYEQLLGQNVPQGDPCIVRFPDAGCLSRGQVSIRGPKEYYVFLIDEGVSRSVSTSDVGPLLQRHCLPSFAIHCGIFAAFRTNVPLRAINTFVGEFQSGTLCRLKIMKRSRHEDGAYEVDFFDRCGVHHNAYISEEAYECWESVLEPEFDPRC